MAFATGKASVDVQFKKYIGIASCHVVTFNPTKEELSKLYGREVTKDTEYEGVFKNNEGVDVKAVYPTFILKTDPDSNNGIEEFFTARFMVTDKILVNNSNTKCKVMDKYGRTAWATKEDVANHTIPTYIDKNTNTPVPFNIDKDFRPIHRGEEELTLFMKNYLNIDDCQKYINNTWVMIDDPSIAESRLDNIDALVKGDFKELKDALEFQPNNKVKVAISVRITNDGREFSTVYTNFTMKNGSNSTKKLEEDINGKKNAGGLQNVVFDFTPLHEYVVKETSFNNTDDLPFSAPTDSPW